MFIFLINSYRDLEMCLSGRVLSGIQDTPIHSMEGEVRAVDKILHVYLV